MPSNVAFVIGGGLFYKHATLYRCHSVSTGCSRIKFGKSSLDMDIRGLSG